MKDVMIRDTNDLRRGDAFRGANFVKQERKWEV